VAISIVLSGALLSVADLEQVMQAVRSADYGILGIAFLLSFLWLAVRARVWQILLRNRAAYRDVLFTAGEGYLLNNFLPFRLGELGRAFLIARKSPLSFAEVLPTILIERVVDLGISAMLLLAALPYVVAAQGSGRIGYIVGSLVGLALAAMYVLARYHRQALERFRRLSVRWPALQRWGGRFLEPFLSGLSVLTEGRLFLHFGAWMVGNWGLALIAYYLMARAYLPQAEPYWSLLILGAAAFGGAIPSAPGAVGTFEGAMAGALVLLAGPEHTSTALAAALTARLYNYLNSGVIGGLGLLREGETLGQIYRELQALRTSSETSKS